LRSIGDADWPDIIARTSVLMRLMLTSPMFEAEDNITRDQSLHAIAQLAKRSGQTEVAVAQRLLGFMNSPRRNAGQAGLVAAHWLHGSGQPDLLRSLELNPGSALVWLFLTRRVALPLYLFILVSTLALVLWLLLRHHTDASGWMLLMAAALAIFPASEAVVAVINRLISESARPVHLPRLALANGIPEEHRVMVVIPGMLTGLTSAQELVHRLHLHYLANPEVQAQFALLTDWADADTEHTSKDADCLSSAVGLIQALNLRHPVDPDGTPGAPRFVLLHRERHFSQTEQRWIGWERKRGKLEQLVDNPGDQELRHGIHGPWHDIAGRPWPRATSSRWTATPSCRPGACASWWAWQRIPTTSPGWIHSAASW
jgi:cyclic beta-1,2-glucan synthetase